VALEAPITPAEITRKLILGCLAEMVAAARLTLDMREMSHGTNSYEPVL
jgi:hypothetical protein